MAPAFLLPGGRLPYNLAEMDYSELPSRLAAVRERIGEACVRSGRDPAGVTIVAVTKTYPAAAVDTLRTAGVLDIGENRVQELEAKVASIGRETVRWHLIGHLQRNKARTALELADLIHSVDSVRIAKKLSDEAVGAGRVVEALVQVNVSGETTKGGFESHGLVERIAEVCELPGLRIVGLMTMAPFTEDTRVIRDVFRRTRELRDTATASIPGFESRHLSMGMSSDFEIAVEEGATLVRLGTILLGERDQ